MHKSQIALGERWKWHFQASRFQNFLGEPSSGSRLRRSRAPPLILPLLRHCAVDYDSFDANFNYTKRLTFGLLIFGFKLSAFPIL